jgi:hypothetical protein
MFTRILYRRPITAMLTMNKILSIMQMQEEAAAGSAAAFAPLHRISPGIATFWKLIKTLARVSIIDANLVKCCVMIWDCAAWTGLSILMSGMINFCMLFILATTILHLEEYF